MPSNLLLPFEMLVNRCIARDTRLAAGIAGVSGKTLLLQVTAPQLAVRVRFYPASVLLTLDSGPAGQPRPEQRSAGERPTDAQDSGPQATGAEYDGKISGSAVALLSLLTSGQKNRPLVNPAIHIGGDSEFVQAVYQLFSQMDVDWQEPISRVIGDVPVHGLEQMLASLKSFSRSSSDSLKRNIDEYLHEESQLVPPLNQVEIFDQNLDALRLRLDRLQARLALLTTGVETFRDRQPGSS